MSEQSDTPRTDKQINGNPCTRFAIMAGDSLRDAMVPSEFARQLERELTAVTEQRDVASQCHKWCYEDRKRIIEELTAVTEQRDGLRSAVDYASDQLTRVTEQRDRLAEALEQWQPIETAPKDRSFILSAHPEHGYLITRWLGAREMWDGWAIEPTHWMSLPKLTTP